MIAADEIETMVLKIGGARARQVSDLDALSRHVREQHTIGHRVLVVHGGGPEIGALHDAMSVPFEKVRGLRMTSPEGMDLVAMVLCGLVNKRIVAHLVSSGVPALGLSGVDLGLLRAPMLDPERLGRVGGAPAVAVEILDEVLAKRRVPVLAPVCIGPDGAMLNVNADTVAQAVATALDADSLAFVSDVPGVSVEDQLAHRLTPQRALRLIDRAVIRGGMVPKMQAALSALEGGVGCVRIGDLDSLRTRTATEVRA